MKIPPEVQEDLQRHLTAIAKLFVAPRITLIVRGPEVGNVKGDLILGNDDPVHVAAALRARMVDEAKVLVGTPHEMTVVEKEPSDPRTRGPRLQSGGPADAHRPRR